MPLPFDLSVLHRALTATPEAPSPDVDRLEPLPPAGLDNDHVRIRGAGLVVRVPRWPLEGMDLAADALALRAARFRRAAPGGHTPALHAVLPPAEGLANGALLVDDIAGRTARVPDDMNAVADALAALHGIIPPPAADRPPLPDAADPAAALVALIERQSDALAAAGASAAVQRLVAAEIDAAQRCLDLLRACPQAVRLVGTDTHPGNFLVDPGGRAVLVDLDKAMYGAPAVDLTHASLATSIFWATGDWEALPRPARREFYTRYLGAVAPELTATMAPWLAPMTRLTWLRTTTWAATWRVSRLPALQGVAGLEDLVAEAGRRTAAFLAVENVEREAARLPDWDAEHPA